MSNSLRVRVVKSHIILEILVKKES